MSMPPEDRSAVGSLRAEDFYRMLDALAVCVLVHDAQSKGIVWANRAACALLEWSLDELVHLKANHMSTQDARYRRAVGLAWLDDAVLSGSSIIEWGYRSKSGHDFLTEAIATKVSLEGGDVLVVQFRDISHESRMRESLSRTTERLETVVTNMDEGIVVLDEEARITYASHAAARLLETGLAELDMASFLYFCTPAAKPAVRAALRRSKARPAPQTLRYEVELPGGELRWHSGRFQHIEIEGDLRGVLVLFHDVTDLVLSEQANRRDLQVLNQLARTNAMGDMAMAIAHELAQPLGAATNFISGTASRLEAGESPASELLGGLQNAKAQLDRASDIVKALRRHVVQLEESQQIVDLNRIVEDCRYFIEMRAQQHGVVVEYQLSPVPVYVACEMVLTGQVVMNLCFNAIDEMAEWPETDRVVAITSRLLGQEGLLSVADRGKGLSRMPGGRIFDGAFSSKASGNGIGLALAHRIITRQNGTISARENTPRGAVFTFTLPRASAEQVADLSRGGDGTAALLGGG